MAAAGSIQLIPYDNWGWNGNMRYEGQPGDNPTQLPLVENRVVTPEFFGVTRQRLLSGRLLRESDDERKESPYVVVVNQALVKRDFPGRNPIGARFYTGDTTFGTIIGVVSDIKNVGPVAPPAPEMYSTFRQSGARIFLLPADDPRDRRGSDGDRRVGSCGNPPRRSRPPPSPTSVR